MTVSAHPVWLAGGLTALVAVGVAGTATAAAPMQRLALLNRTTPAFARPNAAATLMETVSRARPITGERTALPVQARSVDADGAIWLRVLLPGRPNGHSGWIPATSARLASTRWRIAVRTKSRTVTVRRNGHRVRSFRSVVGKASTPTPRGKFFVEETVLLRKGAVGAPYALALSARSKVLQQFAGGPGQIALHGTNNVGGIRGTATSHGCIRLDTQAISWLAARIGPGVPVTITR